jgi:acetoacetate decarboxylase
MFNTLKLDGVDAATTMPKLLTGRYDRSFFNPKAATYII